MPRTAEKTGRLEQIGRRADELIRLLEEHGYTCELKRIQPGDEAKIVLEVLVPARPSLLD